MKNKINRFKTFIAFLLLANCAQAQQETPPFWNDIQAFRKQDSASFPPSNAILMIGSSSFTKWRDVQDYFPSYPVINRGFGGSSLPDLIRYAPDIIQPYHPRQVLIYCGENDLAGSDTTVNGQVVFERFKQLFAIIRGYYPLVQVTYVSMKPSPSRRHLLPKMEEGNQLIRRFLAKRKHASYIDVYNRMLNPDRTMQPGIYLNDSLHMNKNGYAIWQKQIEPYLVK